MENNNTPVNTRPELKDGEFRRIKRFVENNLGIRLPDIKKVMVEARLQKHLTALKLTSFRDYCDLLFESPDGKNNLQRFIDLITTNKTDFFREPGHFDYLSDTLIPEMLSAGNKGIKVWSAACSSGEEPYTISIVLEECIRRYSLFNYEIYASDISEQVLNSARTGIYTMDRIEGLSMDYKKKFFLKSRNSADNQVRVKRFLRQKIRFLQLNLMSDQYQVPKDFDFIFLRNVMIYFEKPVQDRIVRKMYMHLRPGGFLFLGHSESLSGIDIPFKNVSTTVYMKES